MTKETIATPANDDVDEHEQYPGIGAFVGVHTGKPTDEYPGQENLGVGGVDLDRFRGLKQQGYPDNHVRASKDREIVDPKSIHLS